MNEQRAREWLLARRKEIVEGVRDEGARDVVQLDQTSVGRLSRMDALQGQAMAQAAKRRLDQELARIDAALARLDEGEWGYCLTCGEEIAERRLETDPSVATCLDCAR